jgi:DNA-binding NarL/FixJ family response regulator
MVLRVGVLDNDCLVLACLADMLNRIKVRQAVSLDIWSSSDSTMAVQRCCFDEKATDVLLLDMSLSGVNGARLCRMIRELGSSCSIVGMTSYNLDIYRDALCAAGGQALLDKSTLHDELAAVLKVCGKGDPFPPGSGFMSVEQSQSIRHQTAIDKPLTKVERLIVEKSIGGLTCKQIARDLHITVNTVYSHRRDIKRKMRSRSWQDVLDEYRTVIF